MAIHEGDVGVEITYDVGEDISAGSNFKLKYRKPNGQKGELTAVLSGTTAAKYVTSAASILDQPGEWEFQLYLELPGWKGHSEIKNTTILAHL